MSKHPAVSWWIFRLFLKRLKTRGEERSLDSGEKCFSISENIRWTSFWAEVNKEEEHWTFSSQTVSKKRNVVVCHFSFTWQPETNRIQVDMTKNIFFSNIRKDLPELFIKTADTIIDLQRYRLYSMIISNISNISLFVSRFISYVGIFYPSAEPILPHLLCCGLFAVH